MQTIDESRKQRLQLQADISLTQLELNKRKNNVAKLEAQVRAIEDGDEGNLIRLAQVIKSTAGMDGLKVVSFLQSQTQSLIFSRNNQKTYSKMSEPC